MFLSLLNTEQKKAFMSLAYNLAASDGDFSESERAAIKGYSMEMEMEFKMEDVDTDIHNVISVINKICGKREKKIIVFEMIGLAMADYNYDNGERKIVKKALDIFDLDTSFGDFCEKKIEEYLKLQEELNSKILM
jgi:uncharacterized tellurite resistance protein B-like protein